MDVAAFLLFSVHFTQSATFIEDALTLLPYTWN